MSHSVVAVILDQGQTLSKVLAPFDEGLQVEPYVAFTLEEKTEELKNSIERIRENIANEEAKSADKQNTKWLEQCRPRLAQLEAMTPQQYYDECAEDYDKNAEGLPVRTYNPKSRWDWYSVGGRWAGYLKVKDGVLVSKEPMDSDAPMPTNGVLPEPVVAEQPEEPAVDLSDTPPPAEEPVDTTQYFAFPSDTPFRLPGDDEVKYPAGRADAALKRDIDFEGMKDVARSEGFATYDLAEAVLGPIRHLPFTPWSAFVERIKAKELHIDQARDEYHGQEIVKLWKDVGNERPSKDSPEDKLRNLRVWYELEDFMMSREEYAEQRAMRCITPFAMLKDGEWHEKGKMGWFGMVADEAEPDDWQKRFQALLDTVRDDQFIVMVDVHI